VPPARSRSPTHVLIVVERLSALEARLETAEAMLDSVDGVLAPVREDGILSRTELINDRTNELLEVIPMPGVPAEGFPRRRTTSTSLTGGRGR
jgi:hypothetical protein